MRKTYWKYLGTEEEPVFTGDSPSWQLQSDEYYVRDISGKEIALYSASGLIQWNLFGLDQIGHMNADTSKYFYLKDHLGSTRAVVNTQNQVVSANDYDPWGYPLENRSYQSGNTKYKFTGKERDKESGVDGVNGYDYFGARYYDNRIGRWGQVEPLLDKYVGLTPYSYCRDNPLILVDPNGAWDEYVNEAGEYLGSDNDPKSNKVRVTSNEEWTQTTSKEVSSEEKRNELQARSALLSEYKFGISISEQTWSILESKNVDRLEPSVENQSDYTIYYKPEEGDLPWPISPHTDLYSPIDGLNTPAIEPGNVYKVPFSLKTEVNAKGVPNIIGLPESILPLVGEINAPDPSWFKLRDVYKE